MKNGQIASKDAAPDDWPPPPSLVSNPVEAIEKMLRKYCVLPRHAYLAVSLWVVATYLSSKFRAIPYVALLSPVKRCGKSRVLEVLLLLCFKPFSAIAPSPASLFRSIDQAQTLLLDEMEMLKPSKNASDTQQALIAILNAGYKRGATVPRCEGMGREIKVVHWPVYGPKAFATTMRLPSTLVDRCIVLSMQRRTPDQEISRFRQACADREGKDIRDQIIGWVESFNEVVASLYDSLPDLEFLNDRDAEIWSPLFAVCAAVCPDLSGQLRDDAKALSRDKETLDADESLPLRLLEDVLAVWPSTEVKHLHTDKLMVALQQMEDSPWKSDFPLTSRKLARLLKPFGILPRKSREGGPKEDPKRGYFLAAVQKAVARYCPSLKERSGTSGTEPTDS